MSFLLRTSAAHVREAHCTSGWRRMHGRDLRFALARERRGGGAAAILLAALLAWPAVAASANPADRARDYLRRAASHIASDRQALARSYLAPVLLSPWITSAERARAYYARGFSFASQGLHVSAAQDYLRALEFDKTLASALAGLAHLYAEGLGLPRNEALARDLARRAAEGGNAYARAYIGQALLQEGETERARQWLRAAANAGYVPALTLLAQSWRRPYAAAPNPETARRWYEAAQAQGSMDAALALAHMRWRGDLGAAAPAEAARRFEALAARGSAHAQLALAHMLLVGDGVAADAKRAQALYLQAAQAALPAAFVGLGHIAETVGEVGDAAAWYRLGAERNDAAAQYRLGRLLLAGNAADDFAAGLDWLRRAAGAGHAAAQNQAAWILATSNRSRLRDGALAVHLAQRGVAQGETADALAALAAAYAETGDFQKAIDKQQDALRRLSAADARRSAFEARLASYRAGAPWRE